MEYTRGLSPNHIYYRPCHVILRNLPTIQNYSIHTLADLCCVSPSTLSRLSRDLGFKSFQDFKISIIASYRYVTGPEDLDHHFKTPRKDAAIPEEVRGLNYIDYTRSGIEQVRDFVLSGKALEHVALIRRCNHVAFFIPPELEIIPFARKMITCGKFLTVFGKKLSNILRPDEFGLTDNNLSDVCYILIIRLQDDMDFFASHIRSIRDAGGTVIVVYPNFLSLDKDLPNHYFCFQSLDTLGDDITFQSYMNTITAML